MRTSFAAILAAVAGIAAAFPADIPVYTPEERDAGVPDANACYIVAYKLTNCQGNVGAILGVPNKPGNVCIGVGETSGDPRKSYEISAACPILNVDYYRAEGCDGHNPVEQLSEAPGCYNIIDSYTVNSIRAQRAG